MSRMPTLRNEKRAAVIWNRWIPGRDIVLMVARALDAAEKRGRSAITAERGASALRDATTEQLRAELARREEHDV